MGRAVRGRLGPAALALIVLSACGTTHREYADLDEASLLDPEGRTLVVVGSHGSCDRVLEPEVEETPQEVRIQVPLEVENGACDSQAFVLEERVTLSEPLGERRVVNVAAGTRLRVERS